jgi:hypothetical protein
MLSPGVGSTCGRLSVAGEGTYLPDCAWRFHTTALKGASPSLPGPLFVVRCELSCCALLNVTGVNGLTGELAACSIFPNRVSQREGRIEQAASSTITPDTFNGAQPDSSQRTAEGMGVRS